MGTFQAAVVATICTVHALTGAATFIAVYALEWKGHCFYNFSGQDMAAFAASGNICDAPFWTTALVQTAAAWGAQLAVFVAVAVLLIDHWLIRVIGVLLGLCYTVFSAGVLISLVATGLHAASFFVLSLVAFCSLGLLECAICVRFVSLSSNYDALRRLVHGTGASLEASLAAGDGPPEMAGQSIPADQTTTGYS